MCSDINNPFWLFLVFFFIFGETDLRLLNIRDESTHIGNTELAESHVGTKNLLSSFYQSEKRFTE